MKGGKKLGDGIDQMRHIMKQLTPQPALAMAGVGELDDIGSTGDKIQDIIKQTLKIDKSEVGSGIRISGAVKEEVIEDIKAVEEKASKALDDIVEGGDNASKCSTGTNEVLGGSFKDVDAIRGPDEVGHHMPQYAYEKTVGINRNDRSALLMSKEDHVLTRSYRGRGISSMKDDIGLTTSKRYMGYQETIWDKV